MKRFWVFLTLWGGLVTALPAQTGFWLRNTDPSAEFVYWTVNLDRPGALGPLDPDLLLAGLPATPGGPRAVAPGEKVRVVPGEGRSLVGVFVPWTEGLTYRTPLVGGFLLADEFPSKGTVLIDRPAFAAANRGRALSGPLQAWGLVPPLRVLDGKTADWAGMNPLVEWGPGFTAGWKAPAPWPRPTALRASVRDGVLWLWLSADRPWASFPSGTAASLVLRRAAGWLEWPLTGDDGTAWSWVADTATSAGFRVVRGADLEAWLPLDRLTEAERRSLATEPSAWALLVREGASVVSFDLGPLAWGDLE